MARIAIVGEGVVGISTALAIQKRIPNTKITVFHETNFEDSCSYGPAGLFRIDNVNWEKNRQYGKLTFDWYAGLCKTVPGSKTGVKLLSGHIQSDNEETLKAQLGNNFDVIVNCAGLDAGRLAGDDDTVIPIRGIVALVDAPWHKNFLYRDFCTFSIPKQNVVAIGSVKTEGDYRRNFDQSEVDEILSRYCQLQPAMKDAPVIGSWCHLRPFRPVGIRVDSIVKKAKNGQLFSVVHHYGHGGAGFTLAWGSAQEAAQLVQKALNMKSKL